MRADTHDGPEQMLHVRGLIHCCSSHVRRSWNSVLQRTAGPYIMAHPGSAACRESRPVTVPDRNCLVVYADKLRLASGMCSKGSDPDPNLDERRGLRGTGK